jgi:hypothetical protein
VVPVSDTGEGVVEAGSKLLWPLKPVGGVWLSGVWLPGVWLSGVTDWDEPT